MDTNQPEIRERLVEQAKNINERLQTAERGDGEHPLEYPLDVEFTVTGRGDVTEVTATLAVGGPHIELECYNGVVRGYWGSDEIDYPLDDDAADEAAAWAEGQAEALPVGWD